MGTADEREGGDGGVGDDKQGRSITGEDAESTGISIQDASSLGHAERSQLAACASVWATEQVCSLFCG